MYFIISVIRTKTIAVQIIDNINKYIKSLDSILNKKTSECPNRRMYTATSIDPLNISIAHNFVEETLLTYFALSTVNRAANNDEIIPYKYASPISKFIVFHHIIQIDTIIIKPNSISCWLIFLLRTIGSIIEVNKEEVDRQITPITVCSRIDSKKNIQ